MTRFVLGIGLAAVAAALLLAAGRPQEDEDDAPPPSKKGRSENKEKGENKEAKEKTAAPPDKGAGKPAAKAKKRVGRDWPDDEDVPRGTLRRPARRSGPAAVVEFGAPPAAVSTGPNDAIELAGGPSERVRQALARPVTADVGREQCTLAELFDLLRNKLEVDVVVDQKALEFLRVEADLEYCPPVKVRDVPAEEFLRLLLAGKGLAVVPGSTYLLVTDRETRRHEVRVYPVADLVVAAAGKRHLNSSRLLREVIMESVAREEWDAVKDEAASIEYERRTSSFVVRAPAEAHREVARLLAALRQARSRHAELLSRAGLPEEAELNRTMEIIPDFFDRASDTDRADDSGATRKSIGERLVEAEERRSAATEKGRPEISVRDRSKEKAAKDDDKGDEKPDGKKK